jgi:hypothetical protein
MNDQKELKIALNMAGVPDKIRGQVLIIDGEVYVIYLKRKNRLWIRGLNNPNSKGFIQK